MKRKVITSILACMMVVSMAVGCGSTGSTETGEDASQAGGDVADTQDETQEPAAAIT